MERLEYLTQATEGVLFSLYGAGTIRLSQVPSGRPQVTLRYQPDSAPLPPTGRGPTPGGITHRQFVVAPRSYSATLGKATSTDYKGTFFKANPALEGEVVVHHAVEQQVLTKYPGVITEAELHSLENLRGIPKSINSDVHLSKIRIEWNKFYKQFDLNGTVPTRQQLLDKATEIDKRKFQNR